METVVQTATTDPCGFLPATTSSLSTAGSVAEGTERNEPLEPINRKDEVHINRQIEDEFVLEISIQEEEKLQP